MKSKKLNTKIKILVLGGSRGIGKSITQEVKKNFKKVHPFSSKDIDTSNLVSVKNFIKKNKSADVIILNSGGPPNLPFKKIDEKIWYTYFNQLFLGFALILKDLKINNNGYIFYISSSIIKEPPSSLLISSSLRLAFTSLLKSLSKEYSKKNISIINIAPGPFKTGRVKELISNLKEFEKNLPTKKIGDPKEIGKFVNFIIQNKIRYLTGSTVYMDGNTLNSLT
ncbi:SDR family oxidoreductase [Candidatus Pelagibacter sp.]|nr:SDR family oxidoreductase [Candidatus Pelagibacter sp.]